MTRPASTTTVATPLEKLAPSLLASVSGGFGPQLTAAMRRARQLGLHITSTTGGAHVRNSYHYRGRAIDFAGSRTGMREFFTEMSRTHPTELFYDPMGAMKNGRWLGHSIGGHATHVHVAY